MIYIGLFAAVACCGGIITAELYPMASAYWLAAAAGSAILAVILRKKQQSFFLLVLLLLFCCGAWRLTIVSTHYSALPTHIIGSTVYMEGTIEEEKNTYASDKANVTKYVLALDGYAYEGDSSLRQGSGKLYVTLPTTPHWQPASRIGFTGTIRPITYYKNYGLYDSRHHDREQNIFACVYSEPKEKAVLLHSPSGWPLFSFLLRDKLTRQFVQVLGEERAYLLTSLLFGGHYGDLPKELIQSFSTTGLIHILSVSGSHVSLLLCAVQFVGRLIGLRERPLFFVATVLVIFYGALADFTAPVVRSVIMGLICAYSLVARREYSSFHALALAVVAMTLYSPYLVYDLSFRLSCGASAGIVLFQRRIRQVLTPLPNFLRDSLAICFSAQLLLVPLLFSSFSSFPIYSFLANMTVGPVLDIAILLGLSAAILLSILPVSAVPVLWVIKFLLALAVKGNYFIAALPYSKLWAGALAFPVVGAYYASIFSVFFKKRIRRTICVAAGLTILGFSIWAVSHRPDQVVYVFDMGNDRATCSIYSDSSVHLWYNKSQWSNPEQAVCVLTPALRHEGIFHIDEVFICGDPTGRTAKQLSEQFTVIKMNSLPAIDKGQVISHPVGESHSYYIYDSLPAGELPQAACLELRSLRFGADQLPFPAQTGMLILHRSRASDSSWENWQEEAAYHNVPVFTPQLDGEIIGICRKGHWTFYPYGGDSI